MRWDNHYFESEIKRKVISIGSMPSLKLQTFEEFINHQNREESKR